MRKNLFDEPVLILFSILLLLSCQKEYSIDASDSPGTGNGIDSSGIIKSITYRYSQAGPADTGSITESYNYDSANRKIIVTWVSRGAFEGEDYPTGTSAVFSYNNDLQLSEVLYAYPSSVSSSDFYYYPQKIVFQYDAQKKPASVSTTYLDGHIVTTTISKQLIGSTGYKLSWDYLDPNNEQYSLTARFDNNDIAQTFYAADITSDFAFADSVLYDAAGNVLKVYYGESSSLSSPLSYLLDYQYDTRSTKGSELYDFRKKLLNGVGNLPVFDDLGGIEGIDFLGLLAWGFQNEQRQYSKFPFTSGKAWNQYSGSYNSVTATPVFDNKGRLIKTPVFEKDIDVTYAALEISYYK